MFLSLYNKSLLCLLLVINSYDSKLKKEIFVEDMTIIHLIYLSYPLFTSIIL